MLNIVSGRRINCSLHLSCVSIVRISVVSFYQQLHLHVSCVSMFHIANDRPVIPDVENVQ